MMSILSNSQAYRNNSMTIIKGNRGGLSSLGHNTTIYGEESLAENGEIEEMHYLMVRVERIKKQMLASNESNEANNFSDYQQVVLPVASKQKTDAVVKKKLEYKGQVMPVKEHLK